MHVKMTTLVPIELIASKIYLIRGIKVMLDRDLAELYGVETKRSDYIGFWGGQRYPPKEAEMQRLCNQLS